MNANVRPSIPARDRCGSGGRRERLAIPAILLTGLVLLGGGCQRAQLTLADVAVVPGRPVLLRAYVDREGWLELRNGVENVPVTFTHAGQQFAERTTNDDGYCELLVELDFDSAQPTITARCHVEGRALEATVEAQQWSTARTIVVVDVDGTISDTDYDDLLLDLFDKESRPIAGSADTLRKLADEFHICYLTARPRYTARKTSVWLTQHGYPRGPLYTAPALKKVVDQAAFKHELLAELCRAWPSLLIGIGNTDSDRQAYAANGLLTLIHTAAPPTSRPAAVSYFADWAAIDGFFGKHAAQLRRPSALRNWRATLQQDPDSDH